MFSEGFPVIHVNLGPLAIFLIIDGSDGRVNRDAFHNKNKKVSNFDP